MTAEQTDHDGAVLVVPLLDELDAVEHLTAFLRACLEAGAVAEAVVVDGGSTDGSRPALARTDVPTVDARDLPPTGTVRGKGDSVWRALHHLCTHPVVVLVDADVRGLVPADVARLRDAVHDGAVLAKGASQRLQVADGRQRELGGRVTELLARPLLARYAPDLDHVRAPLSGMQAVRLDVARRLDLLSGYGLEASLLLGVRDLCGADAVTEVELSPITHREKDDASLVPMAHEVLEAIARCTGLGTDDGTRTGDERPATQRLALLPGTTTEEA